LQEQWIQADFDGDLDEQSQGSSDQSLGTESWRKMRFWRARIKHVELLSQPPSPSNTSCIEQDWISEVHVYLDEASDPQIVSLHHVKVHDWSYVGTRNSLHTSDLLARVQGKLQALMVPFEPEDKPKTASEKLQDLAKQLATEPKPSKPQDSPAQKADSDPESLDKPPAPLPPEEKKPSDPPKPPEPPKPPKPPEPPKPPVEPTKACTGCNMFLWLWVVGSVWLVCDWKMALVSLVPLVLRCLLKRNSTSQFPTALALGLSAFMLGIGLALTYFGYRWLLETQCDDLFPWWLWCIGLLILLTRYLVYCLPWLLIVLMWNFSLVMMCKDEGEACLNAPTEDSSMLETIYDKVQQNIKDKLKTNDSEQVATSSELAQAMGGRVSIDQALRDTDKYFSCPKDTNSAAPVHSIYFGQEALFGFGDDEFSPSAMRQLQKLATLIGRRPENGIIVTGHADKSGSVVGNIKLSERRAYALSNWLVENNVISAEKITVIGAGDLEPIVNIDSQLPVNRRVEVRINCQRKS